MKSFVILTFIICCSCSKTSQSSQTDLSGTWLLKQYDGGQSYHVIVPTETITITFEKSGSYTSSLNFNIPANGKYNITKDPDGSHYSPNVVNLFADDGNQITYGFSLKKDSLFLFDGCCDMYRYTYVRQN